MVLFGPYFTQKSFFMEITTKSPQKLYNGSFFGPFFTQKSFFTHWKVFDIKSLKQDSIYASTGYISFINRMFWLLTSPPGWVRHFKHNFDPAYKPEKYCPKTPGRPWRPGRKEVVKSVIWFNTLFLFCTVNIRSLNCVNQRPFWDTSVACYNANRVQHLGTHYFHSWFLLF